LIEVEIKVKISDPDLMRKKFNKNDGIYKFSLQHEDIYFNMPKGLRDFKQTDEALRLRKSIEYNRTDKTKSQKINYFITYKGKKIDRSTKTRKEIELKIEDLEKMREMLNTLGFQEVFTVTKERELYEFLYENHHIEALIDFLPILNQYFIEIEHTTNSIENANAAREILFAFLNLLGINKEESITKSYLELILEKENF